MADVADNSSGEDTRDREVRDATSSRGLGSAVMSAAADAKEVTRCWLNAERENLVS